MVLPLSETAIQGLQKQLSHPVIGKKTTITYTDKKGRLVVEEKSVQLRAWEAGVVVVGAGAVALLAFPELLEDLGLKTRKVEAGPFGLFGSFEIKKSS